MRMRENCLIQRVSDSGLEGRVEVGPPHHVIRRLSQHIQRAIQADNAQGQRAGLVRTQHIHAAQVFYGVQAAYDDTALGHSLSAFCHADADDRGQKLGRDAYCQCDGE
ncbi:hypothetical protein SDC9_195108 [bioreactor metagenome]|uniref:Uncharacterized protein n=1 Tax=bioreactor metagenome TaxID=1076179 RepID=A0A645I9C0_9ZZZZ